jgi:hypothetical protein
MATNVNYGGYSSSDVNSGLLQHPHQQQFSDRHHHAHIGQQNIPLYKPLEPTLFSHPGVVAGVFSAFLSASPLLIPFFKNPLAAFFPICLIALINAWCVFKAYRIYTKTDHVLDNSTMTRAVWVATGVLNGIVTVVLIMVAGAFFVIKDEWSPLGMYFASLFVFIAGVIFSIDTWYCYKALNYVSEQQLILELQRLREQVQNNQSQNASI